MKLVLSFSFLVYDFGRCNVSGYPPSCEVFDRSPRNPCHRFDCKPLTTTDDTTTAATTTGFAQASNVSKILATTTLLGLIFPVR